VTVLSAKGNEVPSVHKVSNETRITGRGRSGGKRETGSNQEKNTFIKDESFWLAVPRKTVRKKKKKKIASST